MSYYLLAFLAVFLTVIAQICLKVGAAKGGIAIRSLRIPPMIILGLGLMGIAMLLNVRSLSVLPLRELAFITPVVYILTPLFAAAFLKEKMSGNVLAGTLLVVVGMVVFNLHIPSFH